MSPNDPKLSKPQALDDYFVIVRHPEYGINLILRERLVNAWINKNAKIFKDRRINTDDFIIERATLVDKEIRLIIQKEIPEDFL